MGAGLKFLRWDLLAVLLNRLRDLPRDMDCRRIGFLLGLRKVLADGQPRHRETGQRGNEDRGEHDCLYSTALV